MAASKRPSFLKRQKEQARLARANEKREARGARKQARALRAESGEGEDDTIGSLESLIGEEDRSTDPN